MITFERLLLRLNELGIAISIDPKMSLVGRTQALSPEEQAALRPNRSKLIRVALARELLLEADRVEYPADPTAVRGARIRERLLRWEALLVAPPEARWSAISRRPVVLRPGARGSEPRGGAVIEDNDLPEPAEHLEQERRARPTLPKGEVVEPLDILDERTDPQPEDLFITRRGMYLGRRLDAASSEEELLEPEEVPA